MNKTYRAGLDVGSTTAKITVLDDSGGLIFSRYERHNARVNKLVVSYLDEIEQHLGSVSLRLCATGSVGMSAAEQMKAEFVQEVVAATVFARHRYPEAKALIDIGARTQSGVLQRPEHGAAHERQLRRWHGSFSLIRWQC